MERQVYGMTVNIASVISQKTEKCDHCKCETPTCNKLYVRQGSNRTVCVELETPKTA